MICEVDHFPPINRNLHFFFSSNNDINDTILSLRTVISGHFPAKVYDYNDNIPCSLS